MINQFEPLVLTRDVNGRGRWKMSIPLEKKAPITLYHGTKSCKLDPSKMQQIDGETMLLTPRICHTLLLPKHINKYKLRALNSKNYVVGPLVGILVSEAKIKKLLSGDADSIYRRYAQVLLRNNGLAVFISPKRVLWKRNEVVGVVRNIASHKEIWAEETLPIPCVIYDRCFGKYGRSQSKTLRKKCASQGPEIKVINALPKLGKLQVYKLCSQLPKIREHLPRWDILRPENIDSILEQFPIAYIKPDRLSKGKGVTKVSRTSYGFLVEQRRGNDNYQHLCKSSQEVLKDLEPYIYNHGFMVVQEAIELMTFQGRPFDFRLLLQKDQSGNWKKTGIVARISGEGSVISSPRSGGSVASYDQAMAQLNKSKKVEISASMTNLALNLAKTIDDLIGHFVELGYDFGVDITGKVKIIEVNGIPLKVSLQRLKDPSLTRSAHETPIGYAIYLSGFGR